MSEPVETVSMVGGEPCLDFANTTSQRDSEAPSERLHTYADLVVWARRAGVLDDGDAAALRAEAAARPAGAADALARAIRLREVIYRLFSAHAAGDAPVQADLDRLNAVLREVMPRRQLGHGEDGFSWGWSAAEDPLDLVVGPIAFSAAELLTSEDLARVKECRNDRCGWLFLDASRNRSRRWCDMRDCGNRAKARRHYAKHRRAG